MVEPMNLLASRKHEAVVFVGPARTGKTAALLLGMMTHAVINDPGDMLMIQMTQDKAREFSKTDIDRTIANSPAMRAMMGGKQDDNTHDKMFRHGMWLRIAWPTSSNVSGSTYRYVLITDLDRMENAENVDGEGPLWKLGLKRTQTYGSRGMCLIESSPGIELVDPNWRPATPHEAPPATGILGIYNMSDRRRLYWPCPHCDEHFEAAPGLGLFRLPSEETLLEIVREADLDAIANEHNRIICPHCSEPIGPRAKRTLNQRSVWVPDNCRVNRRGDIEGTPMETAIAGFWMGGVPAAYQSWRSIVLNYLMALRDYALTSSEQSLKATTNTDQGVPYMSMHLRVAAANASDPASRKEKDLQRYVVPDEARFVVANVDIQGGMTPRFVVQVHAVGPHREKWLIDRYSITESNRPGVDGGKAPIDPSKYEEDWDVLTERVVRSTYRTNMEGKELRVKLTTVDTGGEAGVTDKAYAWYRKIRRLGFSNRIMLIKGQSAKETANKPLISQSMVGNRNPKEPGDIPLFLLNSNKLKDKISTDLKRFTPGPGYVHIPSWVPQAWFDELNSEVRNPDGTWTQVRKRNEAWDLLYYCEAACLRLGADRINWTMPPDWAKPQAENSELITREDRREMKENEELVAEVPDAQPEPVVRPRRRVISSPYLG